MSNNVLEKYLNTRQACEYLGIKEASTLYNYIHAGKLRAYRLGGNAGKRRHWRFKVKDLDTFIEQDGYNE